jgi:hypothetical protein
MLSRDNAMLCESSTISKMVKRFVNADPSNILAKKLHDWCALSQAKRGQTYNHRMGGDDDTAQVATWKAG